MVFEGLKERLPLELTNARTFGNRNVLLCCEQMGQSGERRLCPGDCNLAKRCHQLKYTDDMPGTLTAPCLAR